MSIFKQSKKTIAFVTSSLVACLMVSLSLTGCNTASVLPGANGVAATVNGEEIPEETITNYIQGYRTSNSLEDDDAWAEFMVQNNYTAAGMRDDSIDHYIRKVIIKQQAAANNVTVSEDAVDDQIAQIRDYYGYSDETWEEELAAVGYTVDSYREYVYDALLEEALMNTVMTDPDLTDEAVLEVANQYGMAIDGSKQLSVIEFPLGDEALADEVYNKITSGEITFEQAKEEYSAETTYDGWDCIISVDNAIAEAAATMEVGTISGIVTGNDGIYIFQVVDELLYPEEGFTEVSQIPEAIYDEFRNSASQNEMQSDFEVYIQQKIDEADIVVTDFPAGLPYDVDTSKVKIDDDNESESVDDGEGEVASSEESSADAVTEIEGGEFIEGDVPEIVPEGGDIVEEDVILDGGAEEAPVDEVITDNGEEIVE